MHQRVLPDKMKNLHLAFVLRVIDNEQVHGVICKQTEQHVVSLSSLTVNVTLGDCGTAIPCMYEESEALVGVANI